MTKFQQLTRLIELMMPVMDSGRGHVFTELPKIWNQWSVEQQLIELDPDPIGKMAMDYLKYIYAGYNKPEWIVKLGDLA